MDDKSKQFAVRAKQQGYTWSDISVLIGASERSVRYHVKGMLKPKQALKDTVLHKQYLSSEEFPEEKVEGVEKKPPRVTAESLLRENKDEMHAWTHRKPNQTLEELFTLLDVYYRVKLAPNIIKADYERAEEWIAWVYNIAEEKFGPKVVPPPQV